MKKVIVLGAIVAGMAAFTSCKKEFDCTCTGNGTFTTYDKTGKGKDATDACNDAAEKVLGIPTEICVPK